MSKIKKQDKINALIVSDTAYDILIAEYKKDMVYFQTLVNSIDKNNMSDGIYIKLMAYAHPLHMEGKLNEALVVLEELEVEIKRLFGHRSYTRNKITIYISKAYILQKQKKYLQSNKAFIELLKIEPQKEKYLQEIKLNYSLLLNKLFEYFLYSLIGFSVLKIVLLYLYNINLRLFRWDVMIFFALLYLAKYILSKRIENITKENILKIVS